MAKKRGSKKLGRPAKFTTHRVNVSFRLQQHIYEEIKKTGAAAGRSISEEIERRIERLSEWVKEHGTVQKMAAEAHAKAQKVVEDARVEAQKMLAEADEVIASGKEAALHDWRIQPVAGRAGVYVDVDKINPQEMVELNPALETIIERVILRTLEKAKQS
jgi:hypothetical protein